MLTIPHCKESLSKAYVTAVVGHAGHNLAWGDREHDYGVDGSIKQLALRGSSIREIGWAIDFQAKTTINWQYDGNHVVYDIDVIAYNDLVERSDVTSVI